MHTLGKKIIAGFLFAVVACVLLPSASVSAGVQDFTIRSFEADYYLSRSDKNVGEMRVVEKIQAQFPNFNQNRGILRAIPKEYKEESLKLTIESVKNENGVNYEYSTSTSNDNTILRIGDPDRYVQGLNTYVITYTMRSVISFEDGHSELYWDVNGDQWPQTFGSSTARIHIPKEIAANLQSRQLCFAGAFGRNDAECTIERASGPNESVVVTANARQLGPYQTLTFVLGFDDGTFSPYVPSRFERIWPLLFISPVLILPLLTFVYVYGKWRKYGRDPKGKGVIITQYAPPKGFNSLKSSVMLHEKLQNNAISAQVIELAVNGYLSITEIKKKGLLGKADYELELTKDPNGLPSEVQNVVEMFFADGVVVGSRVTLSTLKTKLYTKIAALAKRLHESMFKEGYFSKNPDNARKIGLGKGIALLIIGFVLSFTGVGTPLGIGMMLSGFVFLFAARTMPARTLHGVETRNHLLGLKRYMQLAEADRIKFLQSPKGVKQYGDPSQPKNKIKLFEALLPYAMLFGIEKDWAKEFNDLYTQPPDWYHGNWSTFNTVYLASSLQGFSSTSASTFSPPSSSGSSGFSGGGGSSGGGGGGGGGGGW